MGVTCSTRALHSTLAVWEIDPSAPNRIGGKLKIGARGFLDPPVPNLNTRNLPGYSLREPPAKFTNFSVFFDLKKLIDYIDVAEHEYVIPSATSI